MSDDAVMPHRDVDEVGQTTILTVSLIVMLLGYLLSPAPVMLAFNKLVLPAELRYFTEILYTPIILCYQNSEIIRSFYDAWFAMWGIV